MYSFSYLEPVCCSMSSSSCCFLTCIEVSQEADQVVWYSHLLKNFPQFIVIYTVKGFGIINKAEIYFFINRVNSITVLIEEMQSLSRGFPDSSAGKESTCNAGDPSSIPGSRRSAGEGIGYPLQYYWASLVTQTVKNLPTIQESWVRSLGWEDTLEKGMATHSTILAWKIPWIV